MHEGTREAARDGAPVSGHSREPSRRGRATRAILVAAFSTAIALVSHLLAGGEVPAALGVIVPFGLAVLVCIALSGRLLSMPRLVASVLASQLLFHWLFVLGRTGPAVIAVDDAQAGHHAASITLLPAGADTTAHTGHDDGWMWLGHAIAAILTIALIRRGEAAITGLRRHAAMIARALLARMPRPAALGYTVPRVRAEPERPAVQPLLDASVSRRGPPDPIAFALS